RDKTFYFGEYQGFRQVLGTTQVIPVPTAAERQDIDTTTFPGDTLTVPVNAEIAPVLAHYPLPNHRTGAYAEHTFATYSKVTTRTDQFSVRVDHRISDKATLLTRFSLNQVHRSPNQSGPNGHRSEFCCAIFRSPAEWGRPLYTEHFSAYGSWATSGV